MRRQTEANGAPCDDGDTCSLGDACVNGSCTAGSKDKLFIAPMAGVVTETTTVALVGIADGWAVAGEVIQSTKVTAWTLAQFAPDRTAKWQKTWSFSGLQASADGHMAAAWKGPLGEIVVAGTSRDETGPVATHAFKGRVTGVAHTDGTLLWSTAYQPGPNTRILAGMRHPSQSGSIVAGLHSEGGNKLPPTAGFVAHVSNGGIEIWRSKLPETTVPRHIVARAGGFGIFGKRTINNQVLAACTTFTSTGETVTANAFYEIARIGAVAPYADGAIGVGERVENGKLVGSMFGIDANCGLDFLLFADVEDVTALNAVVHLGGDIGIAAGVQGTGPDQVPVLIGFSAKTRAVVWQQRPKKWAGRRWQAMDVLSDGTAIASSELDDKSGTALFSRLSPWGHKSCKDAGMCASAASSTCDDGNTCTNDFCEHAVTGAGQPTLACVHTGGPKWCDDDDACTTQDRCASLKCSDNEKTKCDDANVCTNDSCEAKKGCVHQPLSGVACPDSDPCTTKETCASGVCKKEAAACSS